MIETVEVLLKCLEVLRAESGIGMKEALGFKSVWRFELCRLPKNASNPRLESTFWHSVVRPNLGTGSSAAAIAAAMEEMLVTAQLPEPTPKVPKVAAPLLPIPGTDLPHYGVSGL